MSLYRIADLLVEMEVSGKTKQQAMPYAVQEQGPADFELKCDIDEILALNPDLMDDRDVAEYMGTGAYFARELLNFQGSFLHSSAVVLDGKAYLFSAPSGTGKSTHTEKWCRLFGARYLNDDKPALRLVNGVWMAYGTPWSGKHDLSSNEGVPVGGIAVLRRGEENTITRLEPAQALPWIMSQSSYRLRREHMEKQLVLMDQLLRQVPIWQLACRNEDAAAEVSHNAMTAV